MSEPTMTEPLQPGDRVRVLFPGRGAMFATVERVLGEGASVVVKWVGGDVSTVAGVYVQRAEPAS